MHLIKIQMELICQHLICLQISVQEQARKTGAAQVNCKVASQCHGCPRVLSPSRSFPCPRRPYAFQNSKHVSRSGLSLGYFYRPKFCNPDLSRLCTEPSGTSIAIKKRKTLLFQAILVGHFHKLSVFWRYGTESNRGCSAIYHINLMVSTQKSRRSSDLQSLSARRNVCIHYRSWPSSPSCPPHLEQRRVHSVWIGLQSS